MKLPNWQSKYKTYKTLEFFDKRRNIQHLKIRHDVNNLLGLWIHHVHPAIRYLYLYFIKIMPLCPVCFLIYLHWKFVKIGVRILISVFNILPHIKFPPRLRRMRALVVNRDWPVNMYAEIPCYGKFCRP